MQFPVELRCPKISDILKFQKKQISFLSHYILQIAVSIMYIL